MGRRFCVPVGVCGVNLDVLVTAPEITVVMPDVSRHLVGMWVHQKRLAPRGRRGRSQIGRAHV